MQFDYFSLTKENGKKWLQSIGIIIMLILAFQLEIISYVSDETDNSIIAIFLVIVLISRFTLSII